MPRGSSIPYRPEVDSLRAIAVILVILFHAQLSIFPGGFIGVDVFFVISGYLITSIIVRQMETGTFSLWGFFASRGRRIIPPVFFMAIAVGIVCLVLPIYVGTNDFMLLKRTFISVILFCSNMYISRNTGGYFDMAAGDNVFLHTWSLSVEAQFYFFYPFFVMFVQRYWPQKKEIALRYLMFFCFTVAIICVSIEPSASFYYFPTRSWELLLGGYVAVSKITPRSQCWKRACTLAGLAMIIASALIFNRIIEPAFPGAWALLPCLGAAMYIVGTIDYGHDDLLWAIATNRALIFTGLISYSLYLWHWPILVIYRQMALGQEIALLHFIGLCTIIYALALLSYKCIEQPVRHRFVKAAVKKQIAVFVFCSLSLTLIASCINYHQSIFYGKYAEGATDENQLDLESANVFGSNGDDKKIDFGVYGDSHGMALLNLFNKLCKENHEIYRIIYSHKYPFLLNAYRPTKEGSYQWRESENNIKKIILNDKLKNIFIISRWSALIKGRLHNEVKENANTDHNFIYNDGHNYYFDSDALEESLRITVTFFKNSGADKVYIILPIPEINYNVPQQANLMAEFYHYSEDKINARLGVTIAEYNKRNKEAIAILQRVAAEFDCVTLIDPTKVLCQDGKHCLVVENGRSLYYDNNHLSKTGAMKLAPLIHRAAPQLFGDVH